jgi:hypothetical protein
MCRNGVLATVSQPTKLQLYRKEPFQAGEVGRPRSGSRAGAGVAARRARGVSGVVEQEGIDWLF